MVEWGYFYKWGETGKGHRRKIYRSVHADGEGVDNYLKLEW